MCICTICRALPFIIISEIWFFIYIYRSNNSIPIFAWVTPSLLGQSVDYISGDGAIHLKQNKSVNTLRPRQNGRHFADDIISCISLNENI